MDSKKHRPISFINKLYLSITLIWLILWFITGDQFWWMTLMNRIVPYLFLPILIFVSQAILRRNSSLVGLNSLFLVIFCWLYWPYLTPKLIPVNGDSDFRVMTFNVLFNNFNFDGVATVIAAHQPDLVALQEVQPETMDALQDRLKHEYPYSLLGNVNSYGTTAVFSRFPFLESRIIDLKADRPAVLVKVEMNGRPITFISAHLLAYGLQWYSLPEIPGIVKQRTANQNRQAKLLLESVQSETGVVILGCDCNTKETSSSYRIVDREFANSARTMSWLKPSLPPETRPDTNLQHIDYIFYRGDVSPTSVYLVERSSGSDHSPLVTDFVFAD